MFLGNLHGFCATKLCFLNIFFNTINIYLKYFHNNKRKGKERIRKSFKGILKEIMIGMRWAKLIGGGS